MFRIMGKVNKQRMKEHAEVVPHALILCLFRINTAVFNFVNLDI